MLGNDFKQNIGNYYTIFLKFEIRHFFFIMNFIQGNPNCYQRP